MLHGCKKQDERNDTLRRRDQAGETLVEILIAVVIIGLVMGTIFATYATAATSSKSHRDLVNADVTLRNSAELTEAAVRKDCTAPGATYSVDYSSSVPQGSNITPPANVTGEPCPPTTGTPAAQVPAKALIATMTGGHTESLTIYVRTP